MAARRRSPWLAALGALVAGCADATATRAIDRLDCDSCHAALYDRQASHAARGYPRACYACHGLSDWRRADATHTAFPIDREPHAGWDCARCHADAADPRRIACTGCHAHTEGRTSPLHIGNGDYEYAPGSCLRCHPDGGEGD